MKKEEYFTLTGYHQKQHNQISYAMEDYIEMIYRLTNNGEKLKLKDLAHHLHVSNPSASIMIKRLRALEIINSKELFLTEKGRNIGEYLLYRHNILICFFKWLNKKQYSLEQVEKVEHFMDPHTIDNIFTFLKKKKIL